MVEDGERREGLADEDEEGCQRRKCADGSDLMLIMSFLNLLRNRDVRKNLSVEWAHCSVVPGTSRR